MTRTPATITTATGAETRIGSVSHKMSRKATEVVATVTIGEFVHEERGFVLASGAIARPCWKCDATGIVTAHLNVFEGQCFACNGRGFTSTVADMDAFGKRARTQARAWLRGAENARAQAEAMAKAEEEARIAREAEEAREAAEREARNAGISYLGEVGAKVTFTGTVRAVKVVSGYSYGSTQVFVIIEGEGFVAKAYSSAAWAYEVERDETVTIAATVKRHEVGREDEPVTLITRAKRTA